MKKILAMILVLAMVLAACPVCFADAAQDWYDYVAGKEDPQLVDMDETLELEDLKKIIHTLPDQPDMAAVGAFVERVNRFAVTEEEA